IGLHFFGGDRNFDPAEIPSEIEIKTADELRVQLPEGNADFHTLALDLFANLPCHADLATNPDSVVTWQSGRRQALADIVRKFQKYAVQAEVVGEETKDQVQANCWKLKLENDWTVPVLELMRGEPQEAVILVADEGRGSAADGVLGLLDSGKRVLAV